MTTTPTPKRGRGRPRTSPSTHRPLWTLGPAHDPAVTAAERRQRKENR